MIWAILRNPAYRGRACYGKTGTGPRQRVTRPLRRPGKFASQQVSGLERPRAEWIEIPVPAVVSAEQFEQAQEQLEANKRHATRRTKEPTLLQGMLVCRRWCATKAREEGGSPPRSRAAQEMEGGPPQPPCRRRLQTTHCCCV